MKGLGWKDHFRLWREAFDDLRRAFTIDAGEVIWSNVVHLNGCRVFFELKQKNYRSRVDLTFDHSGRATTFTKADLDVLQKIEAALRATKSLLDSPELYELAQMKEAELKGGQFAFRLWRGSSDRTLWKRLVSVRWGWITFRITRDKHVFIDIESGEDGSAFPVQLRDLEALEEGLLAAMAAMRPIDEASRVSPGDGESAT